MTDGYYPTVEDLKAHGVEENAEKYRVILAYYASDPLTRTKHEYANDQPYKDVVRYCKMLMYKLSENIT